MSSVRGLRLFGLEFSIESLGLRVQGSYGFTGGRKGFIEVGKWLHNFLQVV